MRVQFEDMVRQFEKVLLSRGMDSPSAKLSATMIAETSLEGVYTHGANRFYFYVKNIDDGLVDVDARATPVGRFGALERWDAKMGPGNLNASICMRRAIKLAKENTIGCVALANNSHWMRPGTYGLMAAQETCIGILWTNTLPLMPAWGGKDAKVGNNPLVLAIPSNDGPVLVDAAMSQFSYGKMETYKREGRALPFDGGFDSEGKASRDAGAIMESKRPMPMGFWKGTSLALALDLIAAALSGGRTTHSIGTDVESEVSQVFIAISLANLPDRAAIEEKITASLADLKASDAIDPNNPVRFPGERRKSLREENMREGIPVDEKIWEKICSL
ncbi:MAG: 3-dehydro-L-gulonate 2-dehydrogenase [Sphaerochaeta sp.]|nr:3-dehydro-L-gulonate 2-dehydrogenase [Sphaerochaeta sp.]